MLSKNELLKLKDKKKNKLEGLQCVTATLTKGILCIYIYKNNNLQKSIFIELNNRLIYNHTKNSWSTKDIKEEISYINLEDGSKNIIDKYLCKLNITESKYIEELPYTTLLNKISSTNFKNMQLNLTKNIMEIESKINDDEIKGKIKKMLPAKIIVHNKNKCFCTACNSDFEMDLKTRKEVTCPKCKKPATTLPLLPYVKSASSANGNVRTTFTNKSNKELGIVTIVKYLNDTDIILLEYSVYINYIVNKDNIDTKPLSECITENLNPYLEKAIVFRQYHSKKVYEYKYGTLMNRNNNFNIIPYDIYTGNMSYGQIYLAYDIEDKNKLSKLKNFMPDCYNENNTLCTELESLDIDTKQLDNIDKISPSLYEYILGKLISAYTRNDFKLITNILNLNAKTKKGLLKLPHLKIKDINAILKLFKQNIETPTITAFIKLCQQNRIEPSMIPIAKDLFQSKLYKQKYKVNSYYSYIAVYENNKTCEKRITKAILDCQNKFIISNNDKKLNVLESLIKIGNSHLATDLLDHIKDLKFNNSTELTKALGITKNQLAITSNYNDLIWHKFNYNNQLKYSNETINILKGYANKPEDILKIMNITSMSVKQIENYIQTLEKQYITIAKYLEYLNKCVSLKKQVTSNTINRPKDINNAIKQINAQFNISCNPVIMEMKTTTDENELQEMFNSLNLYSYNDSKYTIIPPTKPEDIIMEGIALNHCVAKTSMYLKRMYNHESYILFLRKTNDKSTPWYTLEIEPGGVIRQKRTQFDNINKDFDDAMPFLKDWQKHIERLTKEAFANEIEESKAKRIQNLNTLRYQQKTVIINGKKHLLADVLEKDLIQI